MANQDVEILCLAAVAQIRQDRDQSLRRGRLRPRRVERSAAICTGRPVGKDQRRRADAGSGRRTIPVHTQAGPAGDDCCDPRSRIYNDGTGGTERETNAAGGITTSLFDRGFGIERQVFERR